MGCKVRLVDSMYLSPLLHFLCYAVRSLINCKALQTAAMIVETFRKYIDGGSLLVQRHYKRQIYIQNMYPSKDRAFPPPDGRSPV